MPVTPAGVTVWDVSIASINLIQWAERPVPPGTFQVAHAHGRHAYSMENSPCLSTCMLCSSH